MSVNTVSETLSICLPSRSAAPPQLREGGGWRNVPRPTGTEDGQGRGCAQRSTETDAKSSQGPELFQLFEEELSGARPLPLVEVRPQGRVQRHTVNTSSTSCPSCRSSMLRCRRGKTSWWRSSGNSICRFPSRLSKCPRSHLHPVVLAGAGSLVQQTAEQLVEVPTIVSVSSLHVLVEQIVDIPVPHGRDGRGGLQGLRPGQNPTAFGGAEYVDIPVPRGGLQGLRLGQVSTASSSHSPGVAEEVSGFYALFHKKKCPHTPGSELGAEFTPWTPAHLAQWVQMASGPWYLLDNPGVHWDEPG